MSGRIRNHLRGNVVGYVAIFLVLTLAPAWAAGLKKNSVSSKQIKPGGVRNTDLATGAVDSAKVADNSLTGDDVNESSLKLDLSPSGAAGGDLSGQYPNPQIAADSVTAAEVGPNALGGADIDESSLGTVPAAAGAPPTGAAGGDLNGSSYPNPVIAANAVGASEVDGTLTGAEVVDGSLNGADINGPQRSVSLPLPGFVNRTDTEALDFVDSNGTAPDFGILTNALVLIWDDDTDGGGVDQSDTDNVASTFTVPPDYVSGGTIAIRATKDVHSGVNERFDCGVTVNGNFDNGSSGNTTSSAITEYLLDTTTFTVTYTPGASVGLSCQVEGFNGVTVVNANDEVRVHSIAWLYNSDQ